MLSKRVSTLLDSIGIVLVLFTCVRREECLAFMFRSQVSRVCSVCL